MKRIAPQLLLLFAGPLVSLPAFADLTLATSKNCMSCHTIDKKVVGPAYKDVAAKYKGDKSAQSRLVSKIMEGGGGVWGPVPMPANNIKISTVGVALRIM